MESMDVAQEGTSSASTPVVENGGKFYSVQFHKMPALGIETCFVLLHFP